ncbi:MAG: YlxR family protein [Deltaproteobacteria bacterium]|nr:YlxR family protein [Deltaproteobacteria bacterium]
MTSRTCCGCGLVDDRRNLLRFVYCNGGPKVDFNWRSVGRGAYLHCNLVCWRASGAQGRFCRSWRIKLPVMKGSKPWAEIIGDCCLRELDIELPFEKNASLLKRQLEQLFLQI